MAEYIFILQRELLKLKDFYSGEKVAILYITQLFNGTQFKYFIELQVEFTLPRIQFYKYIQLRHAIQS